MSMIRTVLTVVILVIATTLLSAQTNSGGGPGGGLPVPSGAGLCIVSTGSTAGAYNWGSCSGSASSNFSTLAADAANITGSTFLVGDGTHATKWTYNGIGIINANQLLTKTITSLQGNAAVVQMAGTNSGVSGATLCDDANGNATTSGCSSGGLSGMTIGQVPIAASANTVTSSKALQGTDTSIMTAGTISGTGVTLCTDANGGATTSGCSGSGTTTNSVTFNNGGAGGASPQTFNGSSPITISYNTIGAAASNATTTVNSQSCALGSTCTIPFQTNSVNNTSQAGINLLTSTANTVGLTVTPTNSATNQEKFEVTGSYSGTLGSATGLPISTGVSGLGTGIATFLATPSSANLASALTDEIGSGKAVFATALQGSDANLMTAGTVSGTGSTLCTDANGGATTSGCTGGSLPTGPTSPNGVPSILTSTPSGGVAGAATWVLSGVATNAQTGTSYTIQATDRAGYISFSNASAIAVTVPQAGSTSFANNFVFVACDIGAGTATLTPTSSTISYSNGSTYTSGASSMALTTGQCANVYSDNSNYFAILRSGSGGGVSSFTGDGTLISNSGSTGGVTVTLATAGAHKFWGNNTGSTTAPGYEAIGVGDLPSGLLTCSEVWSGSGAASVLQSGDDAISNNTCYNDSGSTRVITAVKCRSDASGNTTTLNPTFGSAGTGTTILSGAVTCGSSYAYSSSGTVSNANWTTGAGIDPGMGGTLSGTSIALLVEYHY